MTKAIGALLLLLSGAITAQGQLDAEVTASPTSGVSVQAPANTGASSLFGGSHAVAHTTGLSTNLPIDLDGDDDADVLRASWIFDRVEWFENVDGQGSFGPPQVLVPLAICALGLDAADLDGDGDPDIVYSAACDGLVAWLENTDGQGTFGPPQVIHPLAPGVTSVQVVDLDGDGDQDVMWVASTLGDRASWHENLDGQGTFGPERPISAPGTAPDHARAGDLDGDGDADVLLDEANSPLAWSENTDGTGTFGPPTSFGPPFPGLFSLEVVDLDGDGDHDVLCGDTSLGLVAWFENTDGLATFGPLQAIGPMASPGGARATDVDADGDPDIIAGEAVTGGIVWYENTDGQATFGSAETISSTAGLSRPADMDGDGDVDVLGGEAFQLVWFENTLASPPWALLDGATPGLDGLPVLLGSGSLVAGTPAGLALSGAPPSAPVLVWASLAPSPFAALGGTVQAHPFAGQLFMNANPGGHVTVSTSWPVGIPPGTGIVVQCIVEDSTSIHGLTLSNGLVARAP